MGIQADPIGFCVLHTIVLLWFLISSFLALMWRNRHLGSFCLICTIWFYLLWLILNTLIPPSKIKVDLKATFCLSISKHLHDNEVCLKYIISLEPENLGERCCTAVCLQAIHSACLDFILLTYQVSWRRIDAKSSLNSQYLGPPTSPCSPPPPYNSIKWIQGRGLFLIQNLGWKSCLESCERSLGAFSMLIIKGS